MDLQSMLLHIKWWYQCCNRVIEYGSGQFFNSLISGQVVPRVSNSFPAFVALLPISAFRSSKATAAIVHDQRMDCCFL